MLNQQLFVAKGLPWPTGFTVSWNPLALGNNFATDSAQPNQRYWVGVVGHKTKKSNNLNIKTLGGVWSGTNISHLLWTSEEISDTTSCFCHCHRIILIWDTASYQKGRVCRLAQEITILILHAPTTNVLHCTIHLWAVVTVQRSLDQTPPAWVWG